MGTIEKSILKRNESDDRETQHLRHKKTGHNSPKKSFPDSVQQLQREIGNKSVRSIMRQEMVQTKLEVGEPDSEYEKEADRVADEVMKMPDPTISRQAVDDLEEEEETEQIQTKPISAQITHIQRTPEIPEQEDEEEPIENVQTKSKTNNAPVLSPSLSAEITSLKGGGAPLSREEKAFFEPRFGTDFSDVRIQTGSKAAQTAESLNARAFTMGNTIAFSRDQYSPRTLDGKKLLAHELTHVVQQVGVANRKMNLDDPGGVDKPKVQASVRKIMQKGYRTTLIEPTNNNVQRLFEEEKKEDLVTTKEESSERCRAEVREKGKHPVLAKAKEGEIQYRMPEGVAEIKHGMNPSVVIYRQIGEGGSPSQDVERDKLRPRRKKRNSMRFKLSKEMLKEVFDKMMSNSAFRLPESKAAGKDMEEEVPPLPSRISLFTLSRLDIGLRLSLPKLEAQKNARIAMIQEALPGAEIRETQFKTAVAAITGETHTDLEDIDKEKFAQATWGIICRNLAPDLARGLSNLLASHSLSDGLSIELDLVIMLQKEGAGLSVVFRF